MITSKQIISLSEEWFKRGDWASKDTDIYINPTSSDYRELNKNKIKSLRFIIDQPTKTVYIANAWNSFHGEIVQNIGGGVKSRFYEDSPNQITGLSTMSGGKSTMSSSDFLDVLLRRYNKEDKLLLNKILKQDWSWADRYIINVTNYLNKIKQTMQSKS